MWNKIGIVLVATLLFPFLLGCSQGIQDETGSGGVVGAAATGTSLVSETEAGDFVVRLISKKAIYEAEEPVELTAKLKYSGEEDKLSIFHGASPFWFHIRETTRGIDIPYIMNLPLKETKLKRDQWLEVNYRKTGSYSEEDEHAQFMKEFLEGDTFPPGVYEIELRADFYTGNFNVKEQKYNISTALIIEVRD
ncbi:MAG: hypothetical protein LRY73_12810 [Bacillus sp. (in: Bacteria)]|nr:hypothetical protein [Bacillus sp. (in: firmicutes)]